MLYFIIDVHGKIVAHGGQDEIEGLDDLSNFYVTNEDEVDQYNIVLPSGTIVTSSESYTDAIWFVRHSDEPDLMIYAVEG